MARRHQLTGRVFGLLTVEREMEMSGDHSRWLCRCLCGGSKVVSGGHLVNGNTTSCGCMWRKARHGHATRREGRTPTYCVWQAMRRRCLQPNAKHYKDYGGRGIAICERWMKYENFLADMGECPEGLTLERKNNDGNYEPTNCRWATPLEQMNNQRKTVRLSYRGRKQSLGNWAREIGVARTTLATRLKRGWSIERTLTTEVKDQTADAVEDDDGFSEYQANENSLHCAGALIFNEKRGYANQMMRISERLGMYDASKLDMKARVR